MPKGQQFEGSTYFYVEKTEHRDGMVTLKVSPAVLRDLVYSLHSKAQDYRRQENNRPTWAEWDTDEQWAEYCRGETKRLDDEANFIMKEYKDKN